MANTRGRYCKLRLLADERARKAYILSLQGNPLRKIAAELGISTSGAWFCLERGKKYWDEETKEHLKTATLLALQEKLGQLEKMLKECTTVKESVACMAEYRQYLKSIRELAGCDDAQKVDVTTGGEPMVYFANEEFKQLIEGDGEHKEN